MTRVAMQVILEIPEELGRRIAADPDELPLLGIPSRYEMDGFLKAHGVYPDLTLDDVRRDSEVARALPG
jgi:hypothetical protein